MKENTHTIAEVKRVERLDDDKLLHIEVVSHRDVTLDLFFDSVAEEQLRKKLEKEVP